MGNKPIRRALAGLTACGVVVAAFAACNDHPLQPLDAVLGAANRTKVSLPAKTKLDFLFLIDDSGSMCEEQKNLAENFTTIAQFLYRDLGDSADYRIAVVNTDMQNDTAKGRFQYKPAPPVPSLNCIDSLTGQPDVPQTEDCADLIGPDGKLLIGPIIKSGPADKGGNIQSQEDLERKFRCMATLGTQGDVFEKGLEAVRTALSCDGPNADKFAPCCDGREYNRDCKRTLPPDVEPEFLRPDALLIVVLVTDEPDCSDPASNPGRSQVPICKYGARDDNGDGVPDGYNDRTLCAENPAACFQRDCGQRPADLSAAEFAAECYRKRCVISRSDNSNCEWNRHVLTPVEEYAEFLNSLKPRPADQIMVAAFVGPQQFTFDGDEITYNLPARPSNPACDDDPRNPEFDPDLPLEVCCPGGRCEGHIKPTCESPVGIAFSGRRYYELAHMYGVNGIGCPRDEFGEPDPFEPCVHICTDDFQTPLELIRNGIVNLVSQYCLDKPPACEVRDDQGNARACDAEQRQVAANYPMRVKTQCLRTTDVGGNCERRVEPSYIPRDQWTLNLDVSFCPGGAQVILSNPPPAGAEIFLEYLVDVNPPRAPRAADAGPQGPEPDFGFGGDEADAGVSFDPDAAE